MGAGVEGGGCRGGGGTAYTTCTPTFLCSPSAFKPKIMFSFLLFLFQRGVDMAKLPLLLYALNMHCIQSLYSLSGFSELGVIQWTSYKTTGGRKCISRQRDLGYIMSQMEVIVDNEQLPIDFFLCVGGVPGAG